MADPTQLSVFNDASWPNELRDFEATLWIALAPEFARELEENLGNLLRGHEGPNRGLFRRIVLADPTNPCIARVRLRRLEPLLMLSVSAHRRGILNAEAGSVTSGSIPSGEVWGLVEPYREEQPNGEFDFSVASELEFSSDKWQPGADLPVPVAGLVPNMVGVPLLTGFDLEFPDSNHPLDRLTLNVYPELNEIAGSLEFRLPFDERESLPTAVCRTVAMYYTMLARPRRSVTSAES